jgi:hypothetical protein
MPNDNQASKTPNVNELTGRFKKIWQRTDQQLEINIQSAVDDCKQFGLDFYIILTGIDAYFEKRKRKEGDRTEALTKQPTKETLK